MAKPSGGYGNTYLDHPLKLGPHTVLVTRGSDWTPEAFEALRAALDDGIVLVHLVGNETIEALDEDTMRTHGWVRA